MFFLKKTLFSKDFKSYFLLDICYITLVHHSQSFKQAPQTFLCELYLKTHYKASFLKYLSWKNIDGQKLQKTKVVWNNALKLLTKLHQNQKQWKKVTVKSIKTTKHDFFTDDASLYTQHPALSWTNMRKHTLNNQLGWSHSEKFGKKKWKHNLGTDTKLVES